MSQRVSTDKGEYLGIKESKQEEDSCEHGRAWQHTRGKKDPINIIKTF